MAHALPSFKGSAACGCCEARRAPLLHALCLAWAGAGAGTAMHGVAVCGAAVSPGVSKMLKEHRGSPGHPPAFQFKAWGAVQRLG